MKRRYSTFVLVLVVFMVLPLTGIIMMEQGADGFNVPAVGYANSAAWAFSAHLAVFFIVFGIARRILPRIQFTPVPVYRPSAYRRLALWILSVTLLALIYLLFVVGAWDVLTGNLNRGLFRAQLGAYGFTAYFIRDFLVPMLGALVAFVYRRTPQRPSHTALLAVHLSVVFLSGAMWGGKLTAVLKILPAVLVLLPRMRLRLALPLAGLALASAVLFGTVFEDLPLHGSWDYVIQRATVGSGDSAWKIWDLRIYRDAYPPYVPTLLGALGGRLLNAIGFASRHSGYEEWYSTDFSALATLVAQDYVAINAATSNVTATVFGEGVIAFGVPGYLLMSILAGLVVAVTFWVYRRAELRHQPLLAIFAANYFAFSVYSWLDSGGITALFAISTVVGYAVTLFVARLMLKLSGVYGMPRTENGWTPRR